MLDALELADGSPELHACLGVLRRSGNTPGHDADVFGAENDCGNGPYPRLGETVEYPFGADLNIVSFDPRTAAQHVDAVLHGDRDCAALEHRVADTLGQLDRDQQHVGMFTTEHTVECARDLVSAVRRLGRQRCTQGDCCCTTSVDQTRQELGSRLGIGGTENGACQYRRNKRAGRDSAAQCFQCHRQGQQTGAVTTLFFRNREPEKVLPDQGRPELGELVLGPRLHRRAHLLGSDGALGE